jgi:hypothetical protein
MMISPDTATRNRLPVALIVPMLRADHFGIDAKE